MSGPPDAFAKSGTPLKARPLVAGRGNESSGFFGGILRFDQRIRSRKLAGLAYEFRIIDGQRHAGMQSEAYTRGLRFAIAPLAEESGPATRPNGPFAEAEVVTRRRHLPSTGPPPRGIRPTQRPASTVLVSSKLKPVIWLGDTLRVLTSFPARVQDEAGYALVLAQSGEKHVIAEPLKGLGPGVLEIVVKPRVRARGRARLMVT